MNLDCWYCYMAVKRDEEDKCTKGYQLEWCDEHCPVYKNMKSCFQASALPEKYWWPFSLKRSDIDKKAVQQIKDLRDELWEFVADGKNLLIQSEKCGNGKTSWGIKLLQKQIELNYKQTIPPAFFVYVPNLLYEARKAISGKNSTFQTMEYMMENCPLVMFDDIGGVPLKDYDLLIISNFIEKRITKNLSSIFTTNCVDEVLKANLGERLFDRVNRLSVVVTLKGNSMRGLND